MSAKPEEPITDYPGKGIPAVDAVIKDGTWKIKMDKNSNKPFFYNPITKETTWDLAKKLATAAPPVPNNNARPKSPVKPSNTNNATSVTSPTFERPKSPVRQNTNQDNNNNIKSNNGLFSSSNQQQQNKNYDPQQLSDPIQRLLLHNKRLVGDIATHEAESITAGMATFETRLDLLVHANNVLAVQLDRRNQEANALQHALTESHETIHKLKNDVKNQEDARALSSFAKTSASLMSADGQMKVSNEEAKRSIAIALETVGRTVVHLQEQNRSLSATIAALTAQLVQNVQATNTSRAMETAGSTTEHQPHEWWRNAKGYSVAALTSRFLDSPGRNALCPKCMMRISDFRDQLLREVPVNEAEKQAQERVLSAQQQSRNDFGGGGGDQNYYSPPIAARINLQPAPTPLNGFANGVGGGTTSSSVGPQRVQPQYVPVQLFNNSNNNNNVNQQQQLPQRGGAFSNVANNYSSGQNNNNNNNGSVSRASQNANGNSGTIRPGALFGGR